MRTVADMRGEIGDMPPRSPGMPAIPADLLLRTFACVVVAASIIQWIMQSATMVISRQGAPDFSVYFTAALILRDNLHANLYDPHLLRATANLHHTYLVKRFALYLYPPLLAILTIPLTFFSFLTAARIWMCLNFVLWIVSAVLVADLLRYALLNREASTAEERLPGANATSAIPPRSVLARALQSVRGLSNTTIISIAVAVFLCATSYGLQQGVALGQVSMLIFFLVLLAPWLIRRGHPMLGGAVLAFAALIKIFPAVLIGYYLLRGRWRVVAGAIGGFVVLTLGMAAVIGPVGILSTTAILTNGKASGVQLQNQSLSRVPLWLAAMFGRNLGKLSSLIGHGLIAAAGLAFCASVLLVWRRERRRHATSATVPARMDHDLLGYSWALATMLLVSPVTWPHHFPWLLPAVVFCLGYTARQWATGAGTASGQSRGTIAIIALLALGYALTMFQLPYNYDAAEQFTLGPRLSIFWVRPFFMLERPLGAILIWCCAGILFLRYSRDNGRAETAEHLVRHAELVPSTEAASARGM